MVLPQSIILKRTRLLLKADWILLAPGQTKLAGPLQQLVPLLATLCEPHASTIGHFGIRLDETDTLECLCSELAWCEGSRVGTGYCIATKDDYHAGNVVC